MAVYHGEERLLFTIDIGDATSSIAIAHLEFGKVPHVRPVSRYPGSGSQSLTTRIPSVIAYDERDELAAVGFDVAHSSVAERVKNGGWIVVSQFKRQLGGAAHDHRGAHRSKRGAPQNGNGAATTDLLSGLPVLHALSRHSTSSSSSSSTEDLSHGQAAMTNMPTNGKANIAKGKNSNMQARHGPTLKTVYANMIKYLVACARSWWIENDDEHQQRIRSDLFAELWSRSVFVIAHPADWTSKQTDVIREAICSSKLLPYDFEPGRLHFVREPASIAHFARRHSTDDAAWLRDGTAFVVVDASSASTSITGYVADSVNPRLKLRAFESVSRVDVGSESVCSAFRTMLDKRLPRKYHQRSTTTSSHHQQDHLSALMNDFETNVLRKFGSGGPNEQIVPVKMASGGGGTIGISNSASAGVHDGHLLVRRVDMESIFRPTVEQILVRLGAVIGKGDASAIIMTGQLGESPFVQRCVREHFASRGVRLVTTDIPATTSVSEGAGLMYLSETCAFSRTTLRSLGISTGVDWSSTWTRESSDRPCVQSVMDGRRIVPGKWSVVVARGESFDGATEGGNVKSKAFHFAYALRGREEGGASVDGGSEERTRVLEVDLYATVDDDDASGKAWLSEDGQTNEDSFEKLGTLEADLSTLIDWLARTKRRRSKTDGREYVVVDVRVMVYVGAKGLEACLAWTVDGQEKRGSSLAMPRDVF